MTPTPVKRVLSFQDFMPWPGVMEYLGEHNYEAVLSILLDPTNVATSMVRLDQLEDAGIPVYLDLEGPLNDTVAPLNDGTGETVDVGVTSTEPESTYETLYCDAMDTLETASSNMKGYAYEGVAQNGASWLRGRTSRDILALWWPTMYYRWEGESPSTYATGAFIDYKGSWVWGDLDHDIDWRLSQVDEVIFEFYAMDEIENAWRIGQYVRAAGKPFGILCLQSTCGHLVPGNGPDSYAVRSTTNMMMDHLYNGYDAACPPPQSWLSEEAITTRIGWGLHKIKEQIGYFDTFVVDWMQGDCPPSGSGDHLPYRQTWIARCEFLESLSLLDNATKGSITMPLIDYIPYYMGASPYCKQPMSLSDTFVNTGNELILIKNGADNCAAHEITVTSTDTLTHEDYTLTCLPDRGTFIGPYPLDEYGALPTIEYDNTNLYVSILKDVPYA